ncbi:uncharacterized protein [Rhodnius prolixus]|uniref:uncharacterized protein n=1 Tax=Rhodnius prolixus TaxID=13249 RepID=UPI003D18A28E
MSPHLSAKAFNRICRLAIRGYNQIQAEIDRVSQSLSTPVTKYQALLDALQNDHNNAKGELTPYRELAEALPDLTLEILDQQLEAVGDCYTGLVRQLSELIRVSSLPASSTRLSIDPQDINTTMSTAPSSINTSNAFYPVQSIPKFSGRPSDWRGFISRFESIINSSNQLNSIQKFQFLYDGLDSNSQTLISHLDFTPEMYPVALNILKKRYDDPQGIIDYHANGLVGLSKPGSSFKDFATFVDTLNVHYRALAALPQVDEHQAIIVSLLVSKFDPATLHEYKKYRRRVAQNNSTVTVNQLLEFIDQSLKERQLDVSHPTATSTPTPRSNYKPKPRFNQSKFKAPVYAAEPLNLTYTCNFCNQASHIIFHCEDFKAKSPRERYNFIKSKNLCINCLRNHSISQCTNRAKCKRCGKPHHTLLHFGTSPTKRVESPQPKSPPSRPGNTTPPGTSRAPQPESSPPTVSVTVPAHVAATTVSTKRQSLLLATTHVRIQTSPHSYLVLRGILDTAAGASFLTDRCVQRLGCRRWHSPISVSGIGNTTATNKGVCSLDIATIGGSILAPQHPFIILDKIAVTTPTVEINASVREAAKHLVLADPSFDKPSRIDCILGSDLASLLFGQGSPITLGTDMPVAVPSPFGYILLGSAPVTTSPSSGSVSNPTPSTSSAVAACCAAPGNELHALVENFWRAEDSPPVSPAPSPQEQLCEQFYRDTTTRDASGLYQVRLPFINKDPSFVANSYAAAYSRFCALERKFKTDPNFQKLYTEFMQDYLDQSHMQLADGPVSYYIPHHGIFKNHGDNPKIRVVFDASAKTPSGTSLNDLLFAGPKLHPLLSDIISLFRQYPFVFSCDIRQMFRQISMHYEDRQFQCILWRSSPDQPIRTYYLNTVTYGTRSAPYLALRTLAQLADDEKTNFPEGAAALKRNIFVDDVAVGAYSLTAAIRLRNQLITLLHSGGFDLRKWVANHPSLLMGIPLEHHVASTSFSTTSACSISLLGALWNPTTDSFSIRLDIKSSPSGTVTKRLVLSFIAQIFDVCGWLAPFTFNLKAFLQALWRQSLQWDTPLPEQLASQWQSLIHDFSTLEQATLPRPFTPTAATTSYILHGFSDASARGYSAVLYLVGVESSSPPALLCAKTRVAPLHTLTIPQLELCGAHLLASLAAHYLNLFSSILTITSVHLWTDSQIVLHWVQLPPYKFKVYVSNRVSQIQDWVPTATWHYVPTNDNPADIASRGCNASTLLNHTLWWHGPSWLSTPSSRPNIGPLALPHSVSSEFSLQAECATVVPIPPVQLFDHIPSWSSLLLVIKLILTWKAKVKGYPPRH